jgi:hypothetical protein
MDGVAAASASTRSTDCFTSESRDSSPSSKVRSKPKVSSGLVSAASVAAYEAPTLGARAEPPPPMAVALTNAGRFAIALASPGSSAERAPRSVMAD